MKKTNDPLLLAHPPTEGSGADVRFKNVKSPGGLGYDSLAKSEKTTQLCYITHPAESTTTQLLCCINHPAAITCTQL